MNLNNEQKKLCAGMTAQSKEIVAASESMGMSHMMAKLTEKVEMVNLLLIPAMTASGLVAGEVKDMYSGKGADAEKVKEYLTSIVQSVAVIGNVFELHMSDIVEDAFKAGK